MFIFHFPLMTKRPCFVFSGSHVLINHHRCILARPERCLLITNKLNNHRLVIIKTKHTFLSRNEIKTHLNGGSISKYYIFHWVYLCHVVLFCWQKLDVTLTAVSAFDRICWIFMRNLKVDQWLCGILIIWRPQIRNGLLIYLTYLKCWYLKWEITFPLVTILSQQVEIEL